MLISDYKTTCLSSFVSPQIPRLEICKLTLIALVWLFSTVRTILCSCFSPQQSPFDRKTASWQWNDHKIIQESRSLLSLFFWTASTFEIVRTASAVWFHWNDHHHHLTWLSFIPGAPPGAEVGEDEWLCDTCRPLSSSLGKQNNCRYFLLCLEMNGLIGRKKQEWIRQMCASNFFLEFKLKLVMSEKPKGFAECQMSTDMCVNLWGVVPDRDIFQEHQCFCDSVTSLKWDF